MIFVDNANISFLGKVWCHLTSDESLEEMHTFAQSIGLKRSM